MESYDKNEQRRQSKGDTGAVREPSEALAETSNKKGIADTPQPIDLYHFDAPPMVAGEGIKPPTQGFPIP